MAAFTQEELGELRSALCRNTPTQNWSKAQVNAGLQAVEDRLRAPGTQNAIMNDIEAAVPGVFDTEQKRLLLGTWCTSAARRLGIV